MDDDQAWAVIVLLGIVAIILAFYGGYTLMETTETPYDKCVDSCHFSQGTTGSANLQLKAECIKSCQLLVKCGVNQ